MRRAKGKVARRGKSGCAGDPQRAAIYAWEDTWPAWYLNTHTLTELRYIVRHACKLYRTAPPSVIQHNRRSMSWCDVEDGRISFQAVGPSGRGGKNVPVALHEVAHLVVFRRFGLRPQDHGPTFLGVYLWLLAKARIAPRVALEASARACGLKWREVTP